MNHQTPFIKLCRHMKTHCLFFCKHVASHKKHYMLWIFGWFAVIRLILLIVWILWWTYHFPYDATAQWPGYISPEQCSSTSEIRKAECEALVDLYNTTNWSAWTNSNNRWDFSRICSWYGVQCEKSTVRNILLSWNNLQGDLPQSIWSLEYLNTLDIGNNAITRIPYTIWKLNSYLTQLYINNNLLHELPTEIGNLSALEILDISHNELDSSQFRKILSLPKIRILSWSHNLIQEIDSIYSNISDTLQQLDLSYNHIQNIDSLTENNHPLLTHLILRHNQIEYFNTINFGNFASIVVLDFGKNIIDSSSIDNLWSLNQLTHLYLDHNMIKTIPRSFDILAKQNVLTTLDLSYNRISIANRINNIISLEYLNLSNNMITAMFDMNKLFHLTSIDLSFNMLSGDIAPVLKEFIKSRNTLEHFSLRHNTFKWNIPYTVDDPNTKDLETFLDFSALADNSGCMIDYNRLYIAWVNNPDLYDFLETKCVDISSSKSFLQLDWKRQYTETATSITWWYTGTETIFGWDVIDINITLENYGKTNTSWLIVSFVDVPWYTIRTSWGSDAIKWRVFDEEDSCKQQLIKFSTWPYVTALDTRASNNWWTDFFAYLQSHYRDHDLYVLDIFDGYPKTWWASFVQWLGKTTFDAFDQTFFGGFDNRLFAIDLNDLAIDGCGIKWKNVQSFFVDPLALKNTTTLSFSLEIDESFDWELQIPVLLENNHRLYEEKKTKDNSYTVVLKIQTPICGNGIVEWSEECDSKDLDSKTCKDFGHTQGELTCSDTCTIISSACKTPSWWNGWTTISRDNCPGGDFSPSYYDDTCWTQEAETDTEIETDTSLSTGWSSYPQEVIDAFAYASDLKITDSTNIEDANINEYILRKEAAKMMAIFAMKELNKTPSSTTWCNFSDISNESIEVQEYIHLSCELWIMGLKKDGRPDTVFNPNAYITRAQFGTMLSRLLYGNNYNIHILSPFPYYKKHLEILQQNNIMTKIDNPVTKKEIKSWIMLMMYRIHQQSDI